MMDSGSAIPTFDVANAVPQGIFDTVTRNAGCNTASDVLGCLRALYVLAKSTVPSGQRLEVDVLIRTYCRPYEQFLNAANGVPGIFSYRSLDLSYVPRYVLCPSSLHTAVLLKASIDTILVIVRADHPEVED